MLTKNFTLLLTAIASNRKGNMGFVPDYVVNTDGVQVPPVNGYSAMKDLRQLLNISTKHLNELGTNNGIGTFGFGNGTTLPNKLDYNLVNPIDDSKFSIVSANTSFAEDQTTLSQQIIYSGTDNIAISELGYFYNYGTSNGGTVYYFPILIARQVIEPMTIKPNDTFQVSMIIG